MVAVGRQIGNHAAETGGAQPLGDGKVVFLAALAAVRQNQRAIDPAELRQLVAAFRELLADLHAPLARVSRRLDHQAWSAVAGGERINADAVLRLFG